MSSELEDLKVLLRERSVTRGDFVLSSGRRSTHYVDARKTTMSAPGLHLVGRLGLRAIRDRGWKPRFIGGLTMGADPVAYAVARASLDDPPTLDAFSVRKAAKEHGTKRRIEGNFEAGSPVVVVEDVITTGGSALLAIDAVSAEGGKVLGVLAVVDREEGGAEALAGRGIEVASITTLSSLGL